MSPFRQRRKKHGKFGTSLMWFAIILLVVVLLAAVLGLGGGLIGFLDKHADVLDSQYIQSIPNIPKDIDRNTLEELKKKWDQKQSKP
ncbi:MAG TPA: hypothetical protein VJZ16_04830 [Syntrophales bacterium]|nr:hypothetical protein [Syntrophales bacterium]